MNSMFKFFLLCGLLGAFFYAYQNSWFIVCLPSVQSQSRDPAMQAENTSRKVTLMWWHDREWKKECIEMIWPNDMSFAIQALINNWLQVVSEEKNEHNNTLFQTVLLSSNKKTIYFSCTRNPFDQSLSIQDKLLWIEGLCKTLCSNGISATHIQFLVKHKPLNDSHLDFSYAWPITGFTHTAL